MTFRSWSLLLAFAVVCLCAAAVQDPKPNVRRPDAESLRRARELARLTPEHEVLRRLAGSWNVTLRTTAADGQVHEDTGKATGKGMLGGRYLALEFELNLRGNETEALQILGFDTLKGLYTASWRDTASTWAVTCQGEPGDELGRITMHGTMVDAYTPNGRPFRMEFDARARGEVQVRIWEGMVGKEVLLQEQRWVR
ncbi:MAG: DUF1579 family protein [Planctomycetes bacterium]|nr:DUF1579 family protein [Planctomycetota bacterium]